MCNNIGFAVVSCLFLCGCMSLESRLQSEDYETRKDAEIELYRLACEVHDEDQIWQAIERITCDEVLSLIAARMSTDDDMLKVARCMKQSSWIAAFILDCPSESVAMELVVRLDQKDVVKVYRCAKSTGLKVACLNSLQEVSLQQLPYDSLMSSEITNITNRAVFRKVLESDFASIGERDQLNVLEGMSWGSKINADLQEEIARSYKMNYSKLSNATKDEMCRRITDAEVVRRLLVRPNKDVIKKSRPKIDVRAEVRKAKNAGKKTSAKHVAVQAYDKEYNDLTTMYLDEPVCREYFIMSLSTNVRMGVINDCMHRIDYHVDSLWRYRISISGSGASDCTGNNEEIMCISDILATIDDESASGKVANELFDKFEKAGVEQTFLRALANDNLGELLDRQTEEDKIIDAGLVWWEKDETILLSECFKRIRRNQGAHKAMLNRIVKKIKRVNKALPLAKNRHKSVSWCLNRNLEMLTSLQRDLEN